MLKYKLLDNIDTTNININNECVICLEDIDNNKVILNCNHAFHKKCALNWMAVSQNCPICRKDTKYILNLEPEKNETIIIEIIKQENITSNSDEEEDEEEDDVIIINRTNYLYPIILKLIITGTTAATVASFYFFLK